MICSKYEPIVFQFLNLCAIENAALRNHISDNNLQFPENNNESNKRIKVYWYIL